MKDGKTRSGRLFLMLLVPALGFYFATGAGGQTSDANKPTADLRQLMRGIMFPSSNVIFAAQNDISKIPPAKDPSVSTDPLTNTYGGWQAVENASQAIAESSVLLLTPGRVCANGRPVPVQRADWIGDVQKLKQAALTTYKAAQTKNTDNMVDAAGDLTDACSACHNVYREKADLKDRCMP